MKIMMRVHFSGVGVEAAAGETIDLPDAEAIRMIDKGRAVPASAVPIERAIQPPPAEVRTAATPEAVKADAPVEPEAPKHAGKHKSKGKRG